MSPTVIFLWSLSAIIAFIFSLIIAGITLTPKYSKGKMILWCFVGLLFDFALVYLSYTINPTVDVMNALGQCIILVIVLILLYSDRVENKIFIGITTSLASSVAIFLFCGTTDQLVGGPLGMFDSVMGPYTVRNIIFFSALKIIVLTIIGILYTVLLRKKFKDMLLHAE